MYYSTNFNRLINQTVVILPKSGQPCGKLDKKPSNFYIKGEFILIFENLEIIFFMKFAENTLVNFQKGVDFMTRQTTGIIKGAAAGLAVGGATFVAVKYLTDSRRARRKTAAKAAKIIGSFMDMM